MERDTIDSNIAVNPQAEPDVAEESAETEVLSENASELFSIVAIGASAGGLKAIEEFFDHMPADSGAAFVIIQHLSPDFRSLMNELLERRTRMEVRFATEGMPLAENTIFLIPPGQNMRLSKNALHLSPQQRSGKQQPHFPINLFFESSATEAQERTISIVLSGTGTDGTQGIQSVSEAGGIVLVQDPVTAEFDGMPRSAIATGLADIVLPPRALANVTYQFVSSPHQWQAFKSHQNTQVNSGQLQQIIDILESYEDIDFTQYKPNMLNRRVGRRSLIAGHAELDSYIETLKTSAMARQELRNDLLITVTRFFRDKEAWAFLETEVLPELVAKAAPGKPIRMWITACATGEEAYSMAILLREQLEKAEKPIEAKIFATDIDRSALAKASAGIYPAAALSGMSDERRDRFFTPKGNQFEVARSLRETIIFASHNLAKDAAFTQMDLVSCRNVLIYMQPLLQQQVLTKLHFSLKSKSILFLGESENLGALSEEFSVRNRKWKIYRKLRDVRLLLQSPSMTNLAAHRLAVQSTNRASQPRFDPLLDSAFAALLERRRATCFLVDRDNRLIHLCGDTLNLFKIATGRASQNAVRMLPESLQFPLTNALHRARQKDSQVTYRQCPVTEPEIEIEAVTLDVSQQTNEEVGSYLLVMIEPEKEIVLAEISEQLTSDRATSQYILQLQQELQATRENLQATIEELETTNEEQQSTNEELIASNEELQSTNEELHSVNEELHTVNSEYQSKIQELVQLNNDVDNLLGSIDIGVIFLDSDFKIRQFTPAATQAFNLLPADIGRPLEQLSHNLEDFEISEVLRQAKAQTPTEKKVAEHKVKVRQNGPYMLLQIYAYLSEEKVRDGLVLTLINVNDIQQSQQMLAAAQADLRQINEQLEQQIRDRTAALINSEQLLRSITQATPNAIYVYDLIERRNIYANTFLERLLGFSAEELQEKGDRVLSDLIHPDDLEAIAHHHQAIADSDADDSHIFQLEYRIRNTKGNWRYFYTQDIIFRRSPAGRPTQILGTAVDISDRKITAIQLQESETRYRTLYQSTPVMMHSVDRDGRLISASDRWLNVLGYQESEVIGEPVANFLKEVLDCEDGCDRVGGKPPKWMDPQGCNDLSCHLVRRDGELIEVLLSAVAEKNEAGEVDRLLAVMIDVTEQNQAEAELNNYREHLEELVAARADEIEKTNRQLVAEIEERQQAQIELAIHARALERSNDSLEEFAYVVSHDLQEPLRAMTIFSQLLEQRYRNDLSSQAKGYLDNIVQGGVRMQAMVDGILDFSRLTHAGRELKPVNLQQILEEISVALRPLLADSEASLTYTDLPTVLADSAQITQVFQNLISNAIKFRSSEPPVIEVAAKRIEASGTSRSKIDANSGWLISVKDNGIGIHKDQQSRIFTLFQRLHTRQEREGYGIGLSICKKIVERHQGRIWIESDVGQGSTFYFTLEALE